MLARAASLSSTPYLSSQTVRSFWMSLLMAARLKRISAALWVAAWALRTSWAAGSMMTEEYPRPIVRYTSGALAGTRRKLSTISTWTACKSLDAASYRAVCFFTLVSISTMS